MKPPTAKKIPIEIIKHGDKRIDNYAWLKDKSNPEVIKYLDEENRYTESVMADTAELQEKLYNEMIGRIKEDDISCPFRQGEYLYYYKEEKGKSYVIHYRKKAEGDAEEEMILDENEIAQNLRYCRFKILPSPDNKILAYMVDTKGDYCYTVYFKNLQTGELLSDVLKNADVHEWSNDNKKVFYVVNKKGNYHKLAFIHTMGQKQEADVLIYQEKDDKFSIWLKKTASKKYMILNTVSFTTTEGYYFPADGLDITPKLIEKRVEGVIYLTEHNGDDFYFRTNYNAKNYRIMKAHVKNPDRNNWKEFVPEKESVKIEDLFMFRNFLVIVERDFGLNKIKVINLKSGKSHYVNFPEPIYTLFLYADVPLNNEFDTKYFRFVYTSFVTPKSYFDHDMEKNENILLKQKEVRGGYNKDDYITERKFAPSHDGKMIPVSIVYKKGTELNGKNHLYISSYGTYGHSADIFFSIPMLSLLDRGFIFVRAHVRGGGELGEDWYKGGKLMNKKNTFLDFISCTEYLIKQGYTYKGGIAAFGISGGGILMGAIANMKPDLFKCIIAKVPFVDILNSLFDSTLENSAAHFGELGDPNIKEQYDYLKSYSPYENVKGQEYPNMLIITGLNDVNVRYWGPVKFAAKLRECNIGSNFILLKTRFESAHFGPSGKYAIFKEMAYEYAFIMKCLGIKE